MIRMQLCEPQLFRKLNLAISFTYAKFLDLVSKHAHCPSNTLITSTSPLSVVFKRLRGDYMASSK